MSFFSKLFGNNNSVNPTNERNAPVACPEAKEEDLIENSVGKEKQESVKTEVYDYSTKFPIDALYAYISQDWEKIGYDDAFNNAEISYMNTRIDVIKSKLELRFSMVRNLYEARISSIKSQIQKLTEFGLLARIGQLNADIELCNGHLEKIKELEERLKNDHTSMTSMIDSYKAGFANGVSEIVGK